MRVGIVGGGVVGRATARCYAEHVAEVRVHDVVPERSTSSLEELLDKSDVVFLCLPTPLDESRGCLSTEVVEETVSYLTASSNWRETVYVLRSTVPIGTTERLALEYELPNLLHSPEFLTARCAALDASTPTRNLIGWTDPAQSGIQALWDLYARRFPAAHLGLMSSRQTELVKLLVNGFFAAKVAWWNEARALSDAIDDSEEGWENVRRAILSDGRIHPSHTLVPGPDGARGFGGSCLPKDAAQLVWELNARSLRDDVTSAALRRNESDRRTK